MDALPSRMRTTEPQHAVRAAGRSTATTLLLGAAAVVALACSSNPRPQALPPQTLAPTPPEVKQPVSNAPQELEPDQHPSDGSGSTPAPPTSAAGVEAEHDPTVLVIERAPTEKIESGPSLFAAAQAEKERRQQSTESTIVLDDTTLKDHSKGKLTFLEEDKDTTTESVAADEASETELATAEGERSSDSPDDDAEDVSDEAWRAERYWRDRVLEPRRGWRESLDLIQELEGDIARLRRDFYAEDDPFYRDSQIKPAWDQALDDLKQSKRDAERYEVELEETILEGRRQGALPGWLREGIELEPTEEELAETFRKEGRFHEPSEPVIAGDDDGGGRV